ncbi:hypothetical protein ACHWQZ_G018492 [Mnemiopsis leidyi]
MEELVALFFHSVDQKSNFPETELEMDIASLFPRSCVTHPPIEFDDRKPLICTVSLKRRVKRDILTATEKLYRECKNAPHPKTIHTKIIGSRRLAEPNSFFGKDMVTWLVESGWSNSVESALFLCSDILFSNKIIVPVYPFIKRFVSETVLYKFSRDMKERKETTPRRENAFKTAKDICLRRMQEHSRRSGRHNSGESDPLATSSSLSIRFRRSSSGGSTPSSGTSSPTDSGNLYIAGNLLLSMIDKGCDGQLMSQLMLRYGFISPVISDSINSKDLSHKQVFYSQEKYKFSDEVVRSVSRLATIGGSRSRRTSVMVAAVNRRLSQEVPLEQQGIYKTSSLTKDFALEKPSMTLDRASFLSTRTPTVHESSVFQETSRRYSLVEPKSRPFGIFEKFRKTSK